MNFDFFTQVPYVHSHRRVIADRPAPYLLQQFQTAECGIGMFQEVPQQIKFTHRQCKIATGPTGRSLLYIEHDIAVVQYPDRRRLHRPGAAQNR